MLQFLHKSSSSERQSQFKLLFRAYRFLQVEVRWSAKWVDKPPNAKRAKLSPTRFSAPQSDEEMMEIYKGKRSANTQKSTALEVKVFREWISECDSEDQVPENSLDQNFAVEYNGCSKTKW